MSAIAKRDQLGAADLPPRMIPFSDLSYGEAGSLHFDAATGVPFRFTGRMARRQGGVRDNTDGAWDDSVRAYEDSL